MEYKDYIISEIVNERGQWQAKIRRQDGKHMLVDGAKVDEFHTPHVDLENEVDKNREGSDRYQESFCGPE